MSKQALRAVLDRVLTWPSERQANVARVIELMEQQDRSQLELTAEQAAEIRRRLDTKKPRLMSLSEFNERLRRRYGV